MTTTTTTNDPPPSGGSHARGAALSAPTGAIIDAELEALRGRRVAVALSGGVDSAVAAARLVEAGAEVVGLALRLHDPDPGNPLAPRACCPPDDLQDARRVAEMLGFPFYVLDGRSEFAEHVVRPFVRSYLGGRTPNPCVGCNAFVKLERLHRRARALGCERLATGHYARRIREAGRDRRTHLFTGVDADKDQSYFLFGTRPELLRDLEFPLGAWTKAEVREGALARGLPVAHKLESQEVCFVGGAGAGRFVMRQPEASGDHAGPVVDEEGKVLGRHHGVMNFTVGQRKGLGIAARHPLHVLSLDPESKTVTVGPSTRLLKEGLTARDASWPAGPPAGPVRARVKIRYRDPGTPARVARRADGQVEVRFEQPVRAVSPGQAAVFYVDDEVLGGAWIEGGT
ncbi:MAG: tRNA 2-thiouridine(34) synthase MnmA [Myxococcota bacterium]